ncbi:hypothetical protein CEXT_51731 [Caerostris extrusa]|uniref:G2/mitotic-specific cyclin-B3 n=1 Tax=Caerostris extrusa TaxID=172846 RepID=A0AAV4QCM2_CAEEX|nr:hypothetical protein CEXT_51731 [Caerostris extrusa]
MYLMQEIVSKAKLQLIGAVAMFIASKFDERNPPLVDDFLYICDDSYERKEFLETETKILLAIRFNLGIPLSYRFLRRYGRCARVSMEMLTLARYILEMSLMDYEVVDILDSKIAAAALLLAHKMKHSEWSPTLEFYSGYKESELIELAIRLNRNISARSVRQLMTIRTKYSHDVFFCVANIEPLLTTNLGSSDMKTVTSLN